MMLTILIPTDFSENAWNATKYAIRFFEKNQVAFHFLHIDSSWAVENNAHMYLSGFSLSKVDDDNEKAKSMREWMDRILQLQANKNHKFLSSIKKGPFIKGIRDYLIAHQITFMVLGTKGASGLKAATIGSKTGEIITKVKCTSLIVPEKAVFSIPVNIAFPTDFNLSYPPSVMGSLLEFAQIYNSSIKVLRVAQTKKALSDYQKAQRDALKSSLAETAPNFHVVENSCLEEGIEAFTSEMQIDVVAMIAKNLNLFQKLLFTPKVARLTYSATIPFLILHE